MAMLSNQTLSTLRRLKLYGMADAFEQQLEQPSTYDLGFEERLALLVDREMASRDSRRLQRLLQLARLRHQACVEEIDYRYKRGLDRRQIASLATCDWIRAHQQLIVTGPTGIGKSWIICALATAACRQGLTVLYARCGRLLEELRIAHADGSYAKKLAQIAKVELLVLDDWGLSKLSQSERTDLLEILEDRCGRRSTAVTSQLPVTAWHEVVGSPTLADAIVDRLTSASHRIVLDGPTMRPARPMGD